MRLMQREEHYARKRLQGRAAGEHGPRLPRWITVETPTSASFLTRWLGSLVDNLRHGVGALVTLAVGTLPFTLLWLFSWWSGWENSFNKGYEQAWIGRTIGLIGVAISLPLLARLPMALAHQAAEGRMGAFFAFHEVRQLIRLAGWRYVGLSLLLVVAAMPLFVAKGAPVFVEQWSPGVHQPQRCRDRGVRPRLSVLDVLLPPGSIGLLTPGERTASCACRVGVSTRKYPAFDPVVDQRHRPQSSSRDRLARPRGADFCRPVPQSCMDRLAQSSADGVAMAPSSWREALTPAGSNSSSNVVGAISGKVE
jgi:hypothetical protein